MVRIISKREQIIDLPKHTRDKIISILDDIKDHLFYTMDELINDMDISWDIYLRVYKGQKITKASLINIYQYMVKHQDDLMNSDDVNAVRFGDWLE